MKFVYTKKIIKICNSSYVCIPKNIIGDKNIVDVCYDSKKKDEIVIKVKK